MSHQNQFISPPPQPPPTTTTTTLTTTIPRASPAREDCWSEDATATLIDAWGSRYVEVNRGHLRQKQWQEVADTVNARHGHVLKARRTDVQCKNRIDTIKKKYKVEKARVVDTNGSYVSPWRFFENLDHLICGPLNSVTTPVVKTTPILPQKRPTPTMSMSQSPVMVAPAAEGEQYFRRNYAAVAAAAAREEEENEEESEDEDEEDEVEAEERDGDGIRKLAKVIEEFGEMYARVEREKQKQLIELEKQRMEFAKEMECQRMQMLVEMQVQLEKIKRVKRSNSDNMYS